MFGFSSNCVIIFPRIINYENKDIRYKELVKESVLKIIKYAESQGMVAECFSTDEVAMSVLGSEVQWVNPCTPEDTNFVSKHCDGLENVSKGKALNTYYAQARSKYKIKLGLSPEERFEIVSKREKLVANNYIKNCKLIFTFCSKSTSYYKVLSTLNDKRLIVEVNPINFIISCKMSGNPIDPRFIFEGYPVQKPIHEWRIDNV